MACCEISICNRNLSRHHQNRKVMGTFAASVGYQIASTKLPQHHLWSTILGVHWYTELIRMSCIGSRFVRSEFMLSTDFLIALQNVMPPRVELEANGLDPDEIESVQATFRFVPRSRSASTSRSELEKMILDNDCSSVEVGLIRFSDRPREHPHGTQVALCEADSIVVSPAGTITMHDHANPDKAMNCAASSERFLDALGVFLTIRREKSKWKGRGNEAAELCAEKAGGINFREFFRLLCGFLD
jgi:hypothetical protein